MPLTNAQYDEIMRDYQRRRYQADEAAERRRALVYEREPRLAELDRGVAAASVRRAKSYIGGEHSALEGMDAEIARIAGQRSALLADLGLSERDLEPVYQCPDCRDTGYIGGSKCRCLRQAEADYLYARSNLRDILERENFSTFSFAHYPADLIDPDSGLSSLALAQAACAKCRGMAEHFGESPESLFFSGNTGTGKTFLTNCIAKELLDKGYSVIYFSAFQIFEILSDHVFDRSAHADAYEPIFTCDLLIIDDLGTEVPNSVTVSQLFYCMNERILSQKPMVISTNLSLREIAGIYSERISSRITEYFTPVRLYGNDIRIAKRLAQR